MRKYPIAPLGALCGAALVTAMAIAVPARADTNPALGLWVDHTGRGAIEISDCDGKLCGHVAWLKDPQLADQCGKQIIGNVKPIGKNKWDRGWIFDPDRGKKFDVELTLLGNDRMRVKGYAGLKWLSESHTWKRAPADMQSCIAATNGATTAAAPAPANGANDRQIDQADANSAKTDAKRPSGAERDTAAAAAASGNRSADANAKSANLSPPNVGQNESASSKSALSPPNIGQGNVTVLNAPGQDAKPSGAPRDTDKARTADRSRDDNPDVRSEGRSKSARRDRDDHSDDMARADEMDDYDDDADERPRRGRVLARLMEQLESGDGPVKLRRSGRNCSVEVPYAGVISFPCERQ